MYYKNILNIRRSDLVLEVGPGETPYWKSDVLADKFDNSDEVPAGTFGGGMQKTYNRPFFKMENNRLPFKNDSFNMLICSHVLEHVPANEIPGFLNELFRVASRVYLEFPTVLYEFIRDIEAHVNMLAIDGEELIYIKKEDMTPYTGAFSEYMQKALREYPDKPLLFCARVFYRGEIKSVQYSDAGRFLERISRISYAARKPNLFCRVLNFLQNQIHRNRRLKPRIQARVDASVM